MPTLLLMAEKEPAPQGAEDPELPVREEPAHDGPPEVEDAARQESEYPADETNEG